MSFSERIERLTDSHYVLPRVGKMRVDVHAFLSSALLAQTDEQLWQQAASAAAYPGIIGFYLMPDTHLGYGIPVGGVAVTDNVIIQAGSGYDISCGVLYLRVPELTAADVADEDKRRRWIRAVEARVATGVGSHRPRHMPRFRESDVEEIFRYGARALGVDAEICERQFIAIDEAALDPDRIGRARDKALPQLGSVGGGNHFIEMQVDRDDGSVWVMIHCGSRGYGWQTANHYFYAGAELRGLPKNRREESWLARRRAARARVLGAPQLGCELRRREPPRHRARRAASARGRVLRNRRSVLRDLAQPRAAGDARAARRPHAARLRASQGRDSRPTRGPSRSRGHAVGEHGPSVPRAGLDAARRGDPVSAAKAPTPRGARSTTARGA